MIQSRFSCRPRICDTRVIDGGVTVVPGTYEGRGTYLYASNDVYEGEYRAGKRDGRGVYMYAGGDVYEGEYKAGKMEGRGTYRLADGTAEVGRYFAGSDVGEGARWTADRRAAYRLRGGKVEEEITLEDAAKIAGALGLVVPPVSMVESDEIHEVDEIDEDEVHIAQGA